MRRSRQLRASRMQGRAALLFLMGAAGSSAHADPLPKTAPGAGALKLARTAWERGEMEVAEPRYREALEKGGLAPNEVVEGYVRLGAARASLGKKEQSLAAFRAAAIIDSAFEVPQEAGNKAAALAATAKKDEAKFGRLVLKADGPQTVPSGHAFTVTATLDAAHVPVVTKMALLARDPLSGKEFSRLDSPAASLEFEVPADLTLPSATVVVRIDALDGHQNRIASAEERVNVEAAQKEHPVAGAAIVDKKSDTAKKGGGFWSSPWPYLIGGVALAGAGTAVYLGTRPTDDVTVGQVGVRAR